MSDRLTAMTRWPFVVLIAGALVGVGAGTTYLMMKREAAAERGPGLMVPEPTPAQPPAAVPEVALTLSKEAIDRAGIVVGRVMEPAQAGRIRVPAVVEPNAYRVVEVTPLIAGRVTSVSAQLGQQVRRGQTLAQVYSPELADAQSRYIAARAELDAHQRELRRTEKLVGIGSASQQELERIHAEHTAAATMVQSLRSQLTLLGLTAGHVEALTSSSAITATVAVPAPIDGIVTERAANAGLNVDTSTKLFTVVDLSTVWLIGQLYERDFGQVRVGTPVTVTTPAYSTLTIEGKVSYIDPAINRETRTAQLRVEVPNRASQLRLGMYADMHIGDASAAEHPMVPLESVQLIGDRSVVYLADTKTTGRFIEREVRIGEVTDQYVAIHSGVQAGDPVVIKGSFALRAESARLGVRPTVSTPVTESDAQAVRVVISEKGFEPDRVPLRAGSRARLTFVRTTDATCATEVSIPSLKITRSLPLNQPVVIEFIPAKSGDVAFACGMSMLTGTLVIH